MNNNTKLPFNIRLLLGICSLPSLYLAYIISGLVMNGDFNAVNYFEWIYSFVGFIAIYVALSGKRIF